MSNGTIHAIDENLFLVEGDWTTRPAVSLPGAAVFRSDDRLYLLDTGTGPRTRAALQAITASFGRCTEAILINSGRHPGLVGNNDLLDALPADARRFVRPPPAKRAGRWAGVVATTGPTTHQTSVPGRDLAVFGEPAQLTIGRSNWTGWQVDDGLVALQATASSGRLAFYLGSQRTLLLPDELVLTPAWSGCDVTDVLRVGALVLRMIDAGVIDVLSMGFGAPLDTQSARVAVKELVDRGRRAGRASARSGPRAPG
jgi:glyoxylase-like metal-dependent hydrolase (beta-lactamase superfamily II)